MGVASGSGWNIWVWLLGVVVRRSSYYLSLLLLYVSVLVLQQHPYFFKCFSFLFQYFFVITFKY